MNYRHAFHAGNFADLAKHAALTLLLDVMTKAPRPLTVIDTHAGAGAYDLRGEEAVKSGEAERGVVRLLAEADAPEGFDILAAAVARANGPGEVVVYPGSPALVCAALRPQDRLIAFEMNPSVHRGLESLLTPLSPQAQAVLGDGFALAASRLDRAGGNLVLIDPPFEARDDYVRTAQSAATLLARDPAAVVLIWTPLKDLETFDAFLRRLEAITAPILVAETRLRPLTDPMAMNGCALVLINPPAGLEDELAKICGWIAKTLGEMGGEGRLWRL